MNDLKELLRDAFKAGAAYEAETYGPSNCGADFETWFACYRTESEWGEGE